MDCGAAVARRMRNSDDGVLPQTHSNSKYSVYSEIKHSPYTDARPNIYLVVQYDT